MRWLEPPVARYGRTELPEDQQTALRRARHLEWASLAFLLTGVVLVYLVMGSSQAMKVAWIEDLLSLVPPISFLIANRIAARRPDAHHPYGRHRAVGSAHLASAVALLAMGTFLAFDSGMGLLAAEHPPIGTMQLFGHTVWAGWLMVAVMAYTMVVPVVLGRLKLPLAKQLHDKVLFSDAQMNKADWMTAGAAIVGVLGIGLGLWWADGAAALFISVSVLKDGFTGVKDAVRDLSDGRARTYDDGKPHPLIARTEEAVQRLPWVVDAAVRMRDMGHVFHTEVFVVPTDTRAVDVDQLGEARSTVIDLDWKLEDVVIVPVHELPDELRPGREQT